jgi:hypothetical protein
MWRKSRKLTNQPYKKRLLLVTRIDKGVEIAVVALVEAERHMNVQASHRLVPVGVSGTRRRPGSLPGDAEPDILPLTYVCHCSLSPHFAARRLNRIASPTRKGRCFVNVSLVMVTAGGDVKETPVKKFPTVIGRGEEADVRIPLGAVSRKHCELAIDDDDELVIRDLKSSNGTYVNRERVTEKELIPGDLLGIGPVVIVVKIDGHPKVVDPVLSYAQGTTTGAAAGGPGGSAIAGVPTWNAQQSSGKPAAPASKPRTQEEEEDARLKKLLEGNPDDSDDFEIDLSDKPKRR